MRIGRFEVKWHSPSVETAKQIDRVWGELSHIEQRLIKVDAKADRAEVAAMLTQTHANRIKRLETYLERILKHLQVPDENGPRSDTGSGK